MLAEAAGAVALKRKERVKQPGLIHAREEFGLPAEGTRHRDRGGSSARKLDAAPEPALVCILVASQSCA